MYSADKNSDELLRLHVGPDYLDIETRRPDHQYGLFSGMSDERRWAAASDLLKRIMTQDCQARRLAFKPNLLARLAEAFPRSVSREPPQGHQAIDGCDLDALTLSVETSQDPTGEETVLILAGRRGPRTDTPQDAPGKTPLSRRHGALDQVTSVELAMTVVAASLSDFGRYAAKIASALVSPAASAAALADAIADDAVSVGGQEALRMTDPRMTDPRMTDPRMTDPRMTDLRQYLAILQDRLAPIGRMFSRVADDAKIVALSTDPTSIPAEVSEAVFHAVAPAFAAEGLPVRLSLTGDRTGSVATPRGILEGLLRVVMALIIDTMKTELGRRPAAGGPAADQDLIHVRVDLFAPATDDRGREACIELRFPSTRGPDTRSSLQAVEFAHGYSRRQVPVTFTDIMIFNLIKSGLFSVTLSPAVITPAANDTDCAMCVIAIDIAATKSRGGNI
jgi:hypothetical protein